VPRRESYNDTFTGEADSGIRAILECDDDEKSTELKRILLNIIKNELTPRQKQIIMLYYFKKIDSVTIAKQLGITPQAVSAVMARARMKIYRFLRCCGKLR